MLECEIGVEGAKWVLGMRDGCWRCEIGVGGAKWVLGCEMGVENTIYNSKNT